MPGEVSQLSGQKRQERAHELRRSWTAAVPLPLLLGLLLNPRQQCVATESGRRTAAVQDASRGMRGLPSHRQRDAHDGSLALTGFYFYFASMGFDDSTNDGKAQTATARLGRSQNRLKSLAALVL